MFPTSPVHSEYGHAPRAPASPPYITLYDVPSHSPQPWAPNIWPIRFILNYKRLRYRTVWVQFPDIETALQSINAPPSAIRPDGRPIYTLPVIVDPIRSQSSPNVISNTNTIADYLERTYPARPVFPEGSRAVQAMFVHYLQEVFVKPLLPIMIPLSHDRLPERSRSHFRGSAPVAGPIGSSSRGRTSIVVTPPVPQRDPQREQAWLATQMQFDFLANILDRNTLPDGDGVVVMGHELSYADFALCSVLIWIQRMAAYDGWSRIRYWNGGRWNRLWERCKEYMDEY